MTRQVSVDDAYIEACTALGEAIVMQRLLAKELAEHQGAEAATTAGVQSDG